MLKVIKDNHGDPIKVEVDYEGSNAVYLTVVDSSYVGVSPRRDEALANLSPKMARKLAKALKKAAKKAERQ